MVILIMGVSGIGKTTVAQLLAAELGWRYVEADSFHPPANIAKMHAGIPLTDEDREPWLRALSRELHEGDGRGENLVLACSALKESYRHELLDGIRESAIVFLQAPTKVVAERLMHRSGHFMPASLLESQIETLEPPADAIELDATVPPGTLVSEIRQKLGLTLHPRP